MNLPALAVRRPVTTLMLLVSVIVVSAIALKRMPLAFLPEVDAPFIGIRIPYPNSNPTQVEKEIVKPVEEVLATLPNVKRMRSSASADSAEFSLNFSWGQQIDVIRMEVSEKIDQVRPSLPAEIGQPLIYAFNTSDIPVIEARIAAEGVDLSQNYELLETRVVNRLRRVSGVARVDLNGVSPREIYIDLDLDAIKSHAIDVSALIRLLRASSSNLVLGQVNDEGMRYSVRAVGRFADVQALRELVVNQQGLRLADIATVAYEEPPLEFGRHLDGKYAIALEVYKESTANTVDVVRAAMRVIEEDIAADPLLNGISVFTWDDQADQITGGIEGLRHAGLTGGILAVLVLYFFLRRFRATLIVSMSIPFSVIAACGVMYFSGMTLNVLSMMGLMLGVGMLVDNAIVVLESIDRAQRENKDRHLAALTGARAVGTAVAASTLTSLIVFLPLIVGSESELTVFLGEVGKTIALTLVCSLFASLTMIPLVSAHFLKREEPKRIIAVEWLEERYVRALGWTLRHRVKTFFILLAVIALSIVPFALNLVEASPFAAQRNTRIRLGYDFQEFAYKSETERTVTQVENFLWTNRNEFMIKGLYSFYSDNEASTWMTLAREDMNDRQIRDLRKKIREELPEIPGVKLMFDDDAEEGGAAQRFAVKFFGQDSEVLAGLAREAERRLETIPGIVEIDTGERDARQEIQVSIDRHKAASLGLTADDVSQIFRFTLGGTRLNRFNAGNREVETWLALEPQDRTDLDDLRSLRVAMVDGREVLLTDIAGFHVVNRAEAIRRENRKVRSMVQASYEAEEWDGAREQVTGMMDSLNMPAGYSWSWDDRVLEQDTQGKEMLINFLLALALVYIVMASLFESLTQPFAILFSIPFALPGAFWMLAATRTPFNLMSQIGLLILMGIVVNNGIVLLDHMNQLRRQGLSREEAILQAGRDRLRAILMTALTTIVGLLPLAIGGSGVAGLFYFPLARTLMGGLISSTFLTLMILPWVDLHVEQVADWAGRLWRNASPDKAPEAPVEPVAAV